MRGRIHIPTIAGAVLLTCVAAVCFTHWSYSDGTNFIIMNFAVCCAVKALGFWVCVLTDLIRGYGRAHFGLCLAVSSAAFVLLLLAMLLILLFVPDGTKALSIDLVLGWFATFGVTAAFLLDLIVFSIVKLIAEFRSGSLD